MDTFKIENNKVIYNGVEYDFGKLPENVVFDGDINLYNKKLSRLPNMSSWVINGNFWCDDNKITSLKGSPKKVHYEFDCSFNKIEIIDAWPEYIGYGFFIHDNPIESIKERTMPLRYLIEFCKVDLYNSKELLMKEFGVDSEDELNAYLLMMEKI